MTRIEDYDISNAFPAIVRESHRLTSEQSADEVRHLSLEVKEGEREFHAGQCVGVLIEGPHEFGNKYHLRLYSVAGTGEDPNSIDICVRRCSYLDDVSGERYPGVASNFLCDRRAGDTITLTGPYPAPFQIPEDKSANLLLIGMGTGIAPFRGLVQHIYKKLGSWEGKIRLFYGAVSGLEMLYMNDERNDFINYFDQDTFRAFESVSPRPHLGSPVALEQSLVRHHREVWELLSDPQTHVIIAGVGRIAETLNSTFEGLAGTKGMWAEVKRGMVESRRWVELIY
jgi:ferredoxin--NADP+ reductase